MNSVPLCILFSGMIATDPRQGGATWAVLQYVLGFKHLGHRVLFVEPLDPREIRPAGAKFEDSTNAGYFRQVVSQFGLVADSALLLQGSTETVGPQYDELLRAAHGADVLVNISGMLDDTRLMASIPRRVYLDLDPAFNQLWHAVEKIDMRLDGHTHFVTVGQSIGQTGSTVPTCGLDWIPTLQPIVLDHWPITDLAPTYGLTTIANWRGYGSVEHDGVFYGQKAHSLRQFITLPTLTDEQFTLALAIHPDETRDLAALAENRWLLLDPVDVAVTPADYRRFIQHSKGEFGIAKSGYVLSRCGWFSDRSVCYLASGRPVIAQETGFSRFLPTGEGLFAFETADHVLEAIEELNRDYHRHASAARALAEEHFDSDRVLTRLLDRVFAGAAP